MAFEALRAATDDLIPGTNDTVSAEGVIPGASDTVPAEGVIPGASDTVPAEGVIPGASDTVPAEGVIPGASDTVPAEGVIPGASDTVPAEGVIPGANDTVSAENIIPGTNDDATGGSGEDAINGTGMSVEDVITGTGASVEDVIPRSSRETILTGESHDQLQDGLRMLDLGCLPLPQPDDWEPTYVQDQSEVTIDSETRGYVHTDDLSDASEVLEEKGCVVLCGPPGSGKTTVAHALLRRCRHDGFKPYIFSDVKDWQAHIAEGRRSVVLMDGTLGEVRVDRQQYRQWRSILRSLLELTEQGHCRLVLTLYPHVLRELRELEAETSSPLLDDLVVTQLMKTSISKDVKERLLNFRLQRLCLEPSIQNSLVEKVIKKDISGPVFHWCCRYTVDRWHASEDPTAIFTFPAEAYVPLLKRMLRDGQHGDTFAAVLALTMKGLGGFLHDRRRVQPHLKELRLQDYSEYHLAEYADVLKGSILGSDDYGFASRVLYEATGLALGRAFSMPIMLKVCDVGFFVSYIRTHPSVDFSVSVGTTDNVRQIFMQKIYDYVVSGQIPEVCQHPSLSSPEFLEEFEAFCSKEKNSLTRFVYAVDTVHGLPLLYWSAWSPSVHLAQWCLKIINRPSFFRKSPSQSVLSSALLCVRFTETSSSLKAKAKTYADQLRNLLKPEQFENNDELVTVAFPIPSQLLTEEAKLKYDVLLKRCQSGVPKLPHTDLSATITEDVVRIKMPRKVWLNLITLAVSEETEVELPNISDIRFPGADTEWNFLEVLTDPGNTELHNAAAQGDMEATRLAVKNGASLTERNNLGMTPPQVAESRRLFLGEYSYDKEYYGLKKAGSLGDFRSLNPNEKEVRQLFKAITEGNMETVKVLLCHKVGVHDRILDESPLHVACRKRGSEDIVSFLLLLGADVNATRVSGDTPLIEACLRGNVDIVRLLVENGADANMIGLGGYSAFDCARISRNFELLEVLLETDPDINHRTGLDQMTALHLACARGDVDLVSRLLTHNADTTVKNRAGLTPFDLALKAEKHVVMEILKKAAKQ